MGGVITGAGVAGASAVPAGTDASSLAAGDDSAAGVGVAGVGSAGFAILGFGADSADWHRASLPDEKMTLAETIAAAAACKVRPPIIVTPPTHPCDRRIDSMPDWQRSLIRFPAFA